MSIFDDDMINRTSDEGILQQLTKFFDNPNIDGYCSVSNGIISIKDHYTHSIYIKKRFPEYFKFDGFWDKTACIIQSTYGDITSQDDIKNIKGPIVDVDVNISNCTLKIKDFLKITKKFKNINCYYNKGVRINVYIYKLNSIGDLRQIKSNKNKLSCIIPLDLYTNVKDLLCSNVNIYKNLMATLYYQNNITEIISPSGSTIYLENILHGKDQIKS